MIERSASDFLMTSAQHRQWARIVRKRGRPDLAFHHEQLARVIERLEQQEAEHMPIACPPLSRAAQKKPRVSGAEFRRNVERQHMRDDRQKESSSAIALAM
jgi:hypothetical protein